LISLKLKFWRLDFNHNLIRSLTFSHSLGPNRKSHPIESMAVQLTKAEVSNVSL
jgi:hypothetical protein